MADRPIENDQRRQGAGRLFEEHGDALVLYARQWLAGSDAEDVVQQVFISLIATGDTIDHPRAWLYRSVRNAALNALRSRTRRRKREGYVAQQRNEWFDSQRDSLVDIDQLQRALQALPDEQREAVMLKTWSGLTLEEIAGVMGVSTTTAFNRYSRGLKNIRKQLEQPKCKPTKTIR